eukprot:747979-Hanusia_phi.AAC.1
MVGKLTAMLDGDRELRKLPCCCNLLSITPPCVLTYSCKSSEQHGDHQGKPRRLQWSSYILPQGEHSGVRGIGRRGEGMKLGRIIEVFHRRSRRWTSN